jgi:hypothetical protein
MHELIYEPMGDLTNPPHKDEKIHELKLAYLPYAHNSQITSICIIIQHGKIINAIGKKSKSGNFDLKIPARITNKSHWQKSTYQK